MTMMTIKSAEMLEFVEAPQEFAIPVKHDLLPINEKDINEQDIKNVYIHFHVFTNDVIGTVWDSHEDLKKWM